MRNLDGGQGQWLQFRGRGPAFRTNAGCSTSSPSTVSCWPSPSTLLRHGAALRDSKPGGALRIVQPAESLFGIPRRVSCCAIGTAGLAWLKTKADPQLGTKRVWGGEMGFVAPCCFFVSFTGLALYAATGTALVPALLAIHLGAVLAFLSADPLFENGAHRLLPLRGPDPRRPAGEAAPGEAKPREDRIMTDALRHSRARWGRDRPGDHPRDAGRAGSRPHPLLPCPLRFARRGSRTARPRARGLDPPLPERIVARAEAADGTQYWPRSIRPPIRRARRVASTRREPCASASTCSPISAPPARARASPRPAARISTALIFRENTEGFYADRNMAVGSGEFMPTPDLALSVRKVSREGSLRIARAAFAHAATRPAGACHGGAQGQCAQAR